LQNTGKEDKNNKDKGQVNNPFFRLANTDKEDKNSKDKLQVNNPVFRLEKHRQGGQEQQEQGTGK